MAILKIDPKAADSPYLPFGGTYGPGAEHEAEVVVHDFIGQVKAGEGPGFDRDCKRNTYCKFVFRVKYQQDVLFLHEYQPLDANSGSKCLAWLKALGTAMTQSGEFDDREPLGKKCLIKVDAPRADKNDSTRMFSGRVQQVIGL